MMTTTRSIGGTIVRPGAVVANPISADRMFGKVVNVGGRCESLTPEQWTPVVLADSAVVWEGEPVETYRAADTVSRSHAKEAIDQALRKVFE